MKPMTPAGPTGFSGMVQRAVVFLLIAGSVVRFEKVQTPHYLAFIGSVFYAYSITLGVPRPRD
jgi:hypothetical protein